MKNNLRCIAIDDDPLITDLIQHFCNKIEEISFCVQCNNPIDGLKLISSESFDIIFLDLNMPNLDGKSFLELKQEDSLVIIITSEIDFAIDSFAYSSVIDYIVKPIEYARFYKAIQKVIQLKPAQQTTKLENKIFIKDGTKWVNVLLSDIQYIKAESNYVTFHLKHKKVTSYQKIKDLDQELPDNFIRIHRSYIINFDNIESFSKEEVKFKDILIPIGASYKDKLFDRMKKD